MVTGANDAFVVATGNVHHLARRAGRQRPLPLLHRDDELLLLGLFTYQPHGELRAEHLPTRAGWSHCISGLVLDRARRNRFGYRHGLGESARWESGAAHEHSIATGALHKCAK